MTKQTIFLLVLPLLFFGSAAFPVAADTTATTTTITPSFLQGLHLGSQGNAVRILQTLLAKDAQIYPEGLITGYFGPLTVQAVQRYQKKYGIASTAFVGTKTLSQLTTELTNTPIGLQTTLQNGVAVTNSCAIIPPGHLIAPGWLRKHGGQAPIVPPCQVLPPGIISQLSTSTATSTNPPGAPGIANVSAMSTTSNAITLQWTTTMPAVSFLEYGTTTGYGSSTALETSFSSTHLVTLFNLLASTLYHFHIIVTGVNNVTATSSDMVFYTAADMTAPNISNVLVSNLATSSAVINWNTNEMATGKIYFTSSSTLSVLNASTVYTNTYTTSHALLLTNLATSTAYLYEIESRDISGNTATSTIYTFHTL